ncbi:OmpA family protein [Neomegalonema perideroedes]|uniref:OmpA family protein n=1 Tax=Neomegalonema perideroedes TaxID=217219 RepID=UPI00035EB557|nr:OmpA family protein [Neomegalonema perideroedes]
MADRMADSGSVSGSGADPRAEARLRAAAEAAHAEAEAARFARLRALLLAQDRDSLARLSARLEAVEGSMGDKDSIREAMAENLVEALRETRAKRGKALASTLAPMMGVAIRAEIDNSKEKMVETFRPIAGRMVKAAVADSFRKLVEDVNARLDALASAQGWRLRMRALLTGRSVSELALADLSARGGVSRILLIDRQSGGLVAQWPEDPADPAAAEMIGGMIAAILSFSEEALRSGEGDELRSLDLNGRSVTLQARAERILAIEASGSPSAERRERMEEAASNFLDALGEAPPEALARPDALAPLARALITSQKASARRGARRRRLALGALLLLGLLGFFAWKAWEAHSREAALERVRAAIAEEPVLDDAPVFAAWSGRTRIQVSGVLPPGADAEALSARLTAAAGEGFPLQARFAYGASPEFAESAAQAEARLSGLAAQMEGLRRARAEAEAALAAARQAQSETAAALEEARARLLAQEAEIAALSERQGALAAETRDLAAFAQAAETPEARLRLWATRSAIFIPDGANLSQARNLEVLDEAVEILSRPGAPRLRVIGYVDRLGSAETNQRLARERAQAVIAELIARGAPADRLIAAARPDPVELVETHGPGSTNRRVQFEAAFSGE